MYTKKKKQKGWLSSALMGFTSMVFLVSTMIAMLSYMIQSERIGEWSGGKILTGFQVIGVFLGAELAKRIYGAKDAKMPVIATGIYIGVTIVVGLLLEGEFQSVGLNILTACGGCLVSCALCFRKNNRNGKRSKGIW